MIQSSQPFQLAFIDGDFKDDISKLTAKIKICRVFYKDNV